MQKQKSRSSTTNPSLSPPGLTMRTPTLKAPHPQIFQTQPHFFFPFPQSSSSLLTFSPLPISLSSRSFLCKPLTTTIFRSVSAHNHHTTTEPWLAQVPEEPTTAVERPPPEEGPIEIPSSSPSIFATSDKPTPIQTATSVLLTGAIAVFLFRSIRRRAKRAKELVCRSNYN